jgi:AGCS family alanine or glycine:cation symporter
VDTTAEPQGFWASADEFFRDKVVAPIDSVIFFDLAFWTDQYALPAVVVWLALGAVFFTLRFQFVNFRAFRHALDCVRGRYAREGDPGEISHFQALSAALSATVGLGNIAGVAIAVGVGGPGAVVWMIGMGFLGMSSKFAECTLAQIYRVTRADGRVSGGPMHYLRNGLAELGFVTVGKVLSVLFAVMCIGGSFGGGNMFQSNQAYAQFAGTFPGVVDVLGGWTPILFGLVLAILVGFVIVGGIRRIGEVAAILVPGMCALYVVTGFSILFVHAGAVPEAISTMLQSAGDQHDAAVCLLAGGRGRRADRNDHPGRATRRVQQRGGHRLGRDPRARHVRTLRRHRLLDPVRPRRRRARGDQHDAAVCCRASR